MWSIQQLVDGPALLILVVANSTPVIVARVLGSRYAAPPGFSVSVNPSASQGPPGRGVWMC